MNLVYIYWSGSEWIEQTIDFGGWLSVGMENSLVLDSNDFPHISYHDDVSGDLKYAFWDGSAWHIEVVDSYGDVGRYSSLYLDSNDNPHITYYQDTYGDLKYAFWDGDEWIIQTLDSSGDVGMFTSLVLDSYDHPHISYCDWENGDLKYCYYDGNIWNFETIDSEDRTGEYTSIILDEYDNPHICYSCDGSYENSNLKYAYWTSTGWVIEIVDSQGGWYNSIDIDDENIPHISYFGKSKNLKYATKEEETDPQPDIDSMSISSNNIILGENIDIYIHGTNIGGLAGQYSSITISFPDFDELNDDEQVSIIDHSFTDSDEYTCFKVNGDLIYDKNENPISAQYLLVEGGTDTDGEWTSEEWNDITVRVTPDQAGVFTIYYRFTLTDDEDSSVKHTDPSSSSYTDQQGFKVYKAEVTVTEDEDDPHPDIDVFSISSETVTLGESVDVFIKAINLGGPAGEYSSITISFPSFVAEEESSYISIIDHSFTDSDEYTCFKVNGDLIYDKNENPISAQYLLVEGGTDTDGEWSTNEQNDITIRIIPKQIGTFTIYCRFTLTNESDSSIKYNNPSYSIHTDQQGFYVQAYTIDVVSWAEPKGIVTLTIDDGYKNIYNEAYPIIKEHNLKASVFMITGLDSFEDSPLMSINELRTLKNNGWDINSHTVTHPHLTKIDLNKAEDEIIQSKKWIVTNNLGYPHAFSYPYGEYNTQITNLVGNNFYFARTTINGLNSLDINKNLMLKTCALWGTKKEGSLETCKQQINEAMTEGKWIIIMIHGVVDDDNHPKVNSNYGWTTTEVLEEFAEYLKNNEVTIKTFSELAPDNKLPIAEAGNTVTTFVGEKIQFDGTAIDDGTIELYEWDFNGDGNYDWNSKTTGKTEYEYSKADIYSAKLRVTDNEGLTATDTRILDIIGRGFWFGNCLNRPEECPFNWDTCNQYGYLYTYSKIKKIVSNDLIWNIVLNLDPELKEMILTQIYLILKKAHGNGHCYGMSSLALHYYNTPDELPTPNIYDLRINDKDKTGSSIYNRIELNQIDAITNFYSFTKNMLLNYNKLNNQNELNNILDHGLPCMVGLSGEKNDQGKKETYSHAVLAYDYNKDNKRLYIYDPNYPDVEKIITFSEINNNYEFKYSNIYTRLCNLGDKDDGLINRFIELILDTLFIRASCPIELVVYNQTGGQVGEFFSDGETHMVIVNNVSDGKYKVQIIGTDQGNYNITILRHFHNKTTIEKFNETIKNGQETDYILSVNDTFLISDIINLLPEVKEKNGKSIFPNPGFEFIFMIFSIIIIFIFRKIKNRLT